MLAAGYTVYSSLYHHASHNERPCSGRYLLARQLLSAGPTQETGMGFVGVVQDKMKGYFESEGTQYLLCPPGLNLIYQDSC